MSISVRFDFMMDKVKTQKKTQLTQAQEHLLYFSAEQYYITSSKKESK